MLSFGSSDIGRKFDGFVFSHFLKIAITVAFLKIFGKVPEEKHVFMRSQITGDKVSIFSFKIFTGKVFGSCLVFFRLLITSAHSALLTGDKNIDEELRTIGLSGSKFVVGMVSSISDPILQKYTFTAS